ncbi:hypothetical protein DLAC_11495 [Tieghemostelium lacteum]|uniref:Uncharacterized protein n=1 Tax=Tieghemostelium lacteum TaxID=361077 RepID=A0A152A6E1_TIELA|nr:hypothetical protein DLAC_11495 [Tieghemostelium lacteum]|eukprot:KYR01804.1 hypothetical protein DLAC_11495 [Tieghemostelium lacteum]
MNRNKLNYDRKDSLFFLLKDSITYQESLQKQRLEKELEQFQQQEELLKSDKFQFNSSQNNSFLNDSDHNIPISDNEVEDDDTSQNQLLLDDQLINGSGEIDRYDDLNLYTYNNFNNNNNNINNNNSNEIEELYNDPNLDFATNSGDQDNQLNKEIQVGNDEDNNRGNRKKNVLVSQMDKFDQHEYANQFKKIKIFVDDGLELAGVEEEEKYDNSDFDFPTDNGSPPIPQIPDSLPPGFYNGKNEVYQDDSHAKYVNYENEVRLMPPNREDHIELVESVENEKDKSSSPIIPKKGFVLPVSFKLNENTSPLKVYASLPNLTPGNLYQLKKHSNSMSETSTYLDFNNDHIDFQQEKKLNWTNGFTPSVGKKNRSSTTITPPTSIVTTTTTNNIKKVMIGAGQQRTTTHQVIHGLSLQEKNDYSMMNMNGRERSKTFDISTTHSVSPKPKSKLLSSLKKIL